MKKMTWIHKLLVRLSPMLFFRWAAKEQKVDYSKIKATMKLFENNKRVDVFLLKGGSRGFIVVLDRKISLHFYQEGDHFYWDGFEIGKYDKGDVTIFDKLIYK